MKSIRHCGITHPVRVTMTGVLNKVHSGYNFDVTTIQHILRKSLIIIIDIIY